MTKGSAELRGVPARVICAFSRRRAEIEAAMELHGSHGRDAAQVAALDTRRTKDRTHSPEELAPEWRRRAARLGLGLDRIATGVPVRGCAIARKAAHELRERGGIDATSVHALLRSRLPLAPGTVLVVDEASMLGTRQFARVLERVDAAHGKLVVVGDTRQLPAIAAGGILGALAARLPFVELKDNRRQQEAWERHALALLRDGETDEALGLYERHGRVRVSDRADEMVGRLLRDWHATNDPYGCLMIAHYRADVRELNGRARAVMRTAGGLGDDELVVDGGRFAAGDHVVVKRNSSRLDVRNGERGVVDAIDLDASALTIRFADRVVQLDAAFLAQKTFGGRPTLEHGYAITAHAAQGVTCRHALVLARDDTYREWAYTTMSRAAVANRLYVIAHRNRGRDEFAPVEPVRDGRALLAAALTRRRAEELALDQLRHDRHHGRSIDR